MLLSGYAFSWIFAFAGITASSAEAAQAIGFMAIFPLTFASSAFVPVDSMPDWLRAFAEVNPFTTMTDAMRALWVNEPPGSDLWLAVVWCLGLPPRGQPLSPAPLSSRPSTCTPEKR